MPSLPMLFALAAVLQPAAPPTPNGQPVGQPGGTPAATPQAPATSQPPTTPTTPGPAAAPAASGDYADAKELLIALEKADEGLDHLRALVRYDVTEVDVDDRSVREGELFFDQVKSQKPGGKAVRRFAVRFDKLRVGTATRDDERVHVFDGRWYAEKTPKDKKINRKEVVPPGESFDPLKIGEGPLPIPLGQKHEDILTRYDAELRPVEDGLDAKEEALRGFVAGCVQVRLVPKAAYRDRDRFTEIRLWYRGKRPEQMAAGDPASDRLLPRLARTVGHNGNITLVQLANVRVNKEATIDPAMMDTTAPAGWDVVETPFRQAAPKQEGAAEDPRPAPAATEPASKDGVKGEEKKGEPAKDAPK